MHVSERHILSRLLSGFLALSFLLPSPQIFAQSLKRAPDDIRSRVLEIASQPMLSSLSAHPDFTEFANSPELAAAPYFDLDDPILDQDPYFARSQKWTSSEKDTEELEWSKTNDGELALHLPNNLGIFHLNQKFSPVLDTSTFIILSVDSDSTLFEDKSIGEMNPGEGVFFIDKHELYRSSTQESPVYVYFMPLSGKGWKAFTDADAVGADKIFLTSLEGRSELIEEIDLASLRDQSRINALFGAYLAAEDYGKHATTQSKEELGFLYPAPGSTMAFGLAFTGLNKENPSHSLNPQDIKISQIEKFLKSFSELALPTAHAISPDVFTQVFTKLCAFSSVMGAIAVLSLVAKHMIPALKSKVESVRDFREGERRKAKDEIKKIRAEQDQAQDDSQPKTWLGVSWKKFQIHFLRPIREKVSSAKELGIETLNEKDKKGLAKLAWREFVESNDVMGHILLANFQIPTATLPTYGVEYPLDRFLPELGSADNSLVRRVANATIFKVRAWSTSGKVNARTMFLAGVIMGSVSTSFMYWQLTSIIPKICAGMAPFLWEAAQQRIQERMLHADTATTDFIVTQVYRSVYGWVMGGAPSFFMESRSQIELFVKREVEMQMRKEGKDPHSPIYEDEFEKNVAVIVDKNLALLGLPSSKEFLFDATTLESAARRRMGYNGDAAREPSDPDRLYYIGEHRIGLIRSSLSRAVKTAKIEFDEARDMSKETRKKAHELLAEALDTLRMSQPEGLIGKRNEELSPQISTKMLLTSLTYLGPPEHGLPERIPVAWIQKAGLEAAYQAAYIYRKVFLSLIYGKKDFRSITPETLEKHGDDALEFLKANPNYEQLTDIEKSRAYDSAIHHLTAKEETDKKIGEFQPYSKDPLARLQRKIALRKTHADIAARQKENPDHLIGHHEFDRIYAEKLAKIVGIQLLEREDITDEKIQRLYEVCHERATHSTRDELAHNEAIRIFIHNLENSEAKKEYIAHLYAKNFIHTYKEITVDTLRIDNDTQLDPHSIATPGVTMKLRQSNLAQRSKIITGTLRFFDSLFGAEVGYNTGIKALAYRTLPGVYDATSSFQRSLIYWPSLVLFRYPYYHVWGMHYPLKTYMLVASFNFLAMWPFQWLKRLSVQNGLKPVQKVTHASLHATLGSWTAFVGQIPVMLLAPGSSHEPASDLYMSEPKQSLENLAEAQSTAPIENSSPVLVQNQSPLDQNCQSHLR